MFQQARKMENVPFSLIRQISAEVNRLRAEGHDVINLGIGEPDFATPNHIIEAMTAAARRGQTHYTDNKGILELRQAIIQKLELDNKIGYTPDEIICTVGVTEGVFLALSSFLNPGDEILVPDPAWLNYVHIPTFNEAVVVPYPLMDSNSFQIDVLDLEQRVTPKTKMLVVINPSNPTGSVQSEAVMADLAAFAIKHDLLIVSDEIYEKICFEVQPRSIASFPGMRSRTIILNGFSKAYAMTGWRLGYVAAPRELIDVMTRLHMYAVTHPAVMIQWAGVAALQGPQEELHSMVREFERRRDYVLSELSGMPRLFCPHSDGAFYLFPNISGTGLSGAEFANRLLSEAHVAVIPGDVFGNCGTDNFRLSYATSMNSLKEAVGRISQFLNGLEFH